MPVHDDLEAPATERQSLAGLPPLLGCDVFVGSAPIGRDAFGPYGSRSPLQPLLGAAGSRFANVADAQQGATDVCSRLPEGHPVGVPRDGSERVPCYQSNQPALGFAFGRSANIGGN